MYLLSSNTPGVAPFLLAAFAIGEKADAESLLPATLEVLSQLGRVDLLRRLTSIVSDGAAVERRIQQLTMERFSRESTTIHTPNPAFGDVVIEYALMGGSRVVFGMDEKHTAKNVLNAQSTGARVLTLGNDVATYSQLLKVVQETGSPLFKRDVVKRDRQDDQAMERYLSAELMSHLIDRNPKRIGFIVYLYVFGEMHSAVQSRSLPHTKRAEMLLTLEYFLQGWQYFVQRHPDCTGENFIPRQLHHIIQQLIRACLGLMYIFRTYHGNRSEPLLLWRHMTEALEHFFASMRRSGVQEFDLVEFGNAAKKALTLMDLEMRLLSGKDPTGQETRTRIGYHHTYGAQADLNLVNLSIFPSDVQMSRIALKVSFPSACLGLLPFLKLSITIPPFVGQLASPRSPRGHRNESGLEPRNRYQPQPAYDTRRSR